MCTVVLRENVQVRDLSCTTVFFRWMGAPRLLIKILRSVVRVFQDWAWSSACLLGILMRSNALVL